MGPAICQWTMAFSGAAKPKMDEVTGFLRNWIAVWLLLFLI